MASIIDVSSTTAMLGRYIELIVPHALCFMDLDDCIRHEFDCAFFGQLYRDFSISPLIETLDAMSVPALHKNEILTNIEADLNKVLARHFTSLDRDLADFHVEWISPTSVYIEKIGKRCA